MLLFLLLQKKMKEKNERVYISLSNSVHDAYTDMDRREGLGLIHIKSISLSDNTGKEDHMESEIDS